MELVYTKIAESDYETVRQVAFNHFEISQKYLVVLKREKAILLNGEPTWLDRSLTCGDTVAFRLNESEQLFEEPEKMKLSILYEDELFLAVDKPPFMPVHTSARHVGGTLSNGVAAIFVDRGIKQKVRIVNRLDRNTSGVCLIAKNRYGQECLARQQRLGQFYKEYRGIVEGLPDPPAGTVCASIARANDDTIRRVISKFGKESVTDYRVVSHREEFSDTIFVLHTGRTHQIRVHMASIGHPVAGDELYGNVHHIMLRQALYCSCLRFTHPLTAENIEIRMSMPNDIQKFYSSFKELQLF